MTLTVEARFAEVTWRTEPPQLHMNTHLILEDGTVLPGAWSREFVIPIARDDPMLRRWWQEIRAYLLPREKHMWAHLPQIHDIDLYYVDWMRYEHGGWGLAMMYHRLDQDGQPLVGWDGNTLFELRIDSHDGGHYYWQGGDEAIEPFANKAIGKKGQEFEILRAKLFSWAEGLANDILRKEAAGQK